MKSLNECKENGTDVSFSRSEKGKIFALKAGQKFSCDIIDIDGCVLKEEEIRKCDWLFLVNDKSVCEKPRAYYVELKGINVYDASEQLYNAIDRTKSQISNYDIEARVISIRGMQPAILNSEYYRKVKRIIKKEIKFCKVHKGNNFTYVENI